MRCGRMIKMKSLKESTMVERKVVKKKTVLVELAELQDREVGDGTTSVVIIAAELLKRANDLVRNKIHPTSVISGYRLAMRESCKYIEDKLGVKVDKLGKETLVNCAKTSMSSKLLASDDDFFANLVVEAVQSVKMTNARGEVKYPIKGINILKAHGKSAKESYLLKGYALNTGRAAQGMPMRVAPARIACLDFNLQKTKMQLGVQVLVTDPRELEKIRQREADVTKERIEKLLKAGANVYFVEAGAIAVRRVRKEDLRHVAKATGATTVSTFADMEGEETFDSSFLGYADEVVEERIADDDVILIKGTKTSNAVSLILRGANDFMLDEMDRALHDALCIVKRTLESNAVGVLFTVQVLTKRIRTSFVDPRSPASPTCSLNQWQGYVIICDPMNLDILIANMESYPGI
ncbi:T-complex protein 1 subunit alpha [Tanacetum coccineum]